MIHKRYTSALVAVLTVFFFLGLQTAFSQTDQPGYEKQAKRDSMGQHSTTMSHPMNNNMSEVRSECQKADRSAGTALTDLRAAKSSNDPKVLKEALDKAEKRLSEIQSSMNNAMKMMSSTRGEHMQGGSQMMQQQREKDRKRGNAMDSTMRQR